uniref:Uncharacterized protein n=2 Tax=Avena sativa TaxID=4498 RepID=A0ACD5UC00_AVESA
MAGGEGTFKANFSAEGVAALRERIREKLNELMEDYTDDTLVEYVVVLLRNGRRKDEAAAELKVFLGKDNDAFVSWLWDHLSSNLHLYVQHKAVSTNDEAKNTRGAARGLPVHNSSSTIRTSCEPEAETQKITRVQQKREWGGMVREQPEAVTLRSVIAPVSHAEEKTYHKPEAARRPRSPDMHHHRKRGREDDTRPAKRTSQQVISAPRRLLQFAVRDAVRPVQPLTPRSESSSKRLRSVVSTVIPDSAVNGRLQKVKSDLRIPGAAAALRAAAEAAEDVLKEKCSDSVFDRHSESVFDRLGRRSLLTATEEPFDFREQDSEDEEYKHIDDARTGKHVEFHERNQYVASDTYMYERETEKASDSAVDNDRHEGTGAVRHNGVNPYRSRLPSSGGKESLVAGYNMTEGAAGVRSRRSIAQDTHANSGPRTSQNVLNISANNNSRTPPNHETSRNAATFDQQEPMGKKDVGSRKAIATVAHVKDTHMTDISKASVNSSSLTEIPKTSSVAATGQPESSPDSRTVFLSNVHFGATKDALSRHFNKFGAILKTLIVSDGATGQPTGSAYIEFLQKDSAEQALTLNGTSFMSRILKVVRKSSVEVPQVPGWSRGARASPFASRLIRTAYPRPTFPGAIRGRLGLRGSARTFQWKREAADSIDAGKPSQATPTTPGSQTLTPMTRSFTYTRTEPK